MCFQVDSDETTWVAEADLIDAAMKDQSILLKVSYLCSGLLSKSSLIFAGNLIFPSLHQPGQLKTTNFIFALSCFALPNL